MALKILMFGWEFPPFNSGGLGVACKGLCKALSSLNNEILFVLPKSFNIKTDFLKFIFADTFKGIKFKTIESPISPYMTSKEYQSFNFFEKSPMYGRSLFNEVKRYAAQAKRIAKNEKFDIIHAHDWLTFLAGIEAKEATKKPLVIHVHSTEFDRTGGAGGNQYVYDIERIGMEKADIVIAVSELTKNIIINNYGIDREKVRVVHNGVDYEEHYVNIEPEESLKKLKKDGKKIILFLGRITIQKGPDYFLKAAKKVLGYNPNIIFIMAGSGDMEAQIIQESAYMGISDKIFFTGFLCDAERDKIFKLADLFILPSVSEPFGIAPLEALINDTPVLISKQSGVSEVLSHALKVDFWDIDEMVNKILAVTEHSSLADCLANNGKQELSKINWTNAAKKCVEVYHSVLR